MYIIHSTSHPAVGTVPKRTRYNEDRALKAIKRSLVLQNVTVQKAMIHEPSGGGYRAGKEFMDYMNICSTKNSANS